MCETYSLPFHCNRTLEWWSKCIWTNQLCFKTTGFPSSDIHARHPFWKCISCVQLYIWGARTNHNHNKLKSGSKLGSPLTNTKISVSMRYYTATQNVDTKLLKLNSSIMAPTQPMYQSGNLFTDFLNWKYTSDTSTVQTIYFLQLVSANLSILFILIYRSFWLTSGSVFSEHTLSLSKHPVLPYSVPF